MAFIVFLIEKKDNKSAYLFIFASTTFQLAMLHEKKTLIIYYIYSPCN